MRFEGSIKSWNEERGFGFVRADDGDQEIFFHIKAFPRHAGRPQCNQRISFEVESRNGKKQAKNIDLPGPARIVKPPRNAFSTRQGLAGYFSLFAFSIVYGCVSVAWGIPYFIAVMYAGAGTLCFIAYALDKSAARNGRWRTPESTLLLLGLACGWPGAILAQQWLRHKSNKASFRLQFWLTVVCNVAAFIYLTSPISFIRRI